MLDRGSLRFLSSIPEAGRWRVDPNFDPLSPKESPKPSAALEGAGGSDVIPNASNF